MAAYSETSCRTENPRVFRVIDDGDGVLTTFDPVKALRTLSAILEKYEISHCWVDEEEVK